MILFTKFCFSWSLFILNSSSVDETNGNNHTFGWSITYKINQIFFDLNDMLEFGVQPSKNTFELNEFGIVTSVPITNVHFSDN